MTHHFIDWGQQVLRPASLKRRSRSGSSCPPPGSPSPAARKATCTLPRPRLKSFRTLITTRRPSDPRRGYAMLRDRGISSSTLGIESKGRRRLFPEQSQHASESCDMEPNDLIEIIECKTAEILLDQLSYSRGQIWDNSRYLWSTSREWIFRGVSRADYPLRPA